MLLRRVASFTKGGLHSECCTTSSGISNLRRELTFSQTVVFSTAVFTALRSDVMCDTPTVLLVHNEIMCAFLLQSTQLHYVKKQWKQA